MGKYTFGANELRSKSNNLWKAILAEFIGIFILNFFSCAACTQSGGDKVLISLAFGLSVFMAAMVSVDSFIIGKRWIHVLDSYREWSVADPLLEVAMRNKPKSGKNTSNKNRQSGKKVLVTSWLGEIGIAFRKQFFMLNDEGTESFLSIFASNRQSVIFQAVTLIPLSLLASSPLERFPCCVPSSTSLHNVPVLLLLSLHWVFSLPMFPVLTHSDTQTWMPISTNSKASGLSSSWASSSCSLSSASLMRTSPTLASLLHWQLDWQSLSDILVQLATLDLQWIPPELSEPLSSLESGKIIG